VLRQNCMRTENSAIPYRYGCPILGYPFTPSAKILPGEPRAVYLYICGVPIYKDGGTRAFS
jgi:hypothetical protein